MRRTFIYVMMRRCYPQADESALKHKKTFRTNSKVNWKSFHHYNKNFFSPNPTSASHICWKQRGGSVYNGMQKKMPVSIFCSNLYILLEFVYQEKSKSEINEWKKRT